MKNFIINKKYFLIAIICSIIIAYLDLMTKSLAFKAVENNFIDNGYPYIIITDFFNIVKVWNFGVSFGMFNDLEYSKEIFVVLVSLISIGLISGAILHTESHNAFPIKACLNLYNFLVVFVFLQALRI